ncbi:MFS transporter [Saccharopolyspora cebuensis]|uniref:MFS transporter n=1 Tax=Saccharopolyspora cebuensis TaxID=418759 RepID=A0ABV4CGS8_9PSEU
MRTSTRATTRDWCGLVFLLLPALLISMDISVLFVAAPAISAALDPSPTQWLWIMDVYTFVLAGLLLTMGSLGDRIGRKRLLLLGSALFGAASLLIAAAPTAELLLVGRALLGIGAATLAPSTFSLVRSTFVDEGQRRTAIAAWTVAFSGGAAAGPILGGLLLEHFWWGSVFLINVPVMVLLLLAVPWLVRESRDPSAARFDLPGAATSLLAVLALVFAAKHLVEHGLSPLALGAGLLGAIALAGFVRRQRRAAHPLIDLVLLRFPAFRAALAGNVVVSFAISGLGLLTFTFLQTVHGLSPLAAALWAMPAFAGTFLGAVLAGALGGRVRPVLLLVGGLLFGAVGFGVVAAVEPRTPLVVLIGGYALLTAGVGVVGTIANALVLETAPADRAGAAAGLSETSTELGSALGIATFGTLAAAVYRAGAEGVPGGTVAEAVADLAPDSAALAVAFDAYTGAINAAALLGAAVLVVVAVITGFGLRAGR